MTPHTRRSALRTTAATRDELRGEIAATRDDLHGEIEALRTDTQAGFARLERMLADGLDETRRFMRVLYEDTLSRIALLAEHRPTS